MDRLESMTVLLAAVEAGSLSAAGRALGMPLATVSRKVSELESHLGARLLLRSTRKLTLTDAGRSYVDACRRILDDLKEAERTAAGEYLQPRGELIVAAPVVFGRLHALPVVVDFLREYPEVDIRLMLGDRNVDLLGDDTDLALRFGALPDSSLVAIGLGTVRHVACASPAYLAAHGMPDEPGALIRHQCISFDVLGSSMTWPFMIGGQETPVPVRTRLTVTTAEAAIDAAIAGVGVARVLSYQIASAQRSGLLSTVLDAFAPEPVPVSLVYPGQGRLAVKMRAFIDFAVPRLRERLSPSPP